MANLPPSPTASSTATMSSVPISSTPSSNSTKKVRHLPTQRSGLKQPRRFPSQEGTGSSPCRAPAVPNHHRSLRQLPGAMAQRIRASLPIADATSSVAPAVSWKIPWLLGSIVADTSSEPSISMVPLLAICLKIGEGPAVVPAHRARAAREIADRSAASREFQGNGRRIAVHRPLNTTVRLTTRRFSPPWPNTRIRGKWCRC